MRPALKLTLGAAAATVGLVAFNDLVRWNVGPVPRCVVGEPHFYQWREGAIYYEAAGPLSAPPLLLAHGINAAASSYEMRQIFAPLAQRFRVYLPDMLGYGRSERPGIHYSAGTLIDMWSDFCQDICTGEGNGPVNVIASSLSAAHLVGAAARHPKRFGQLLLVCPTGLETLASPATPAQDALYALLSSPVLGTALFNGLASRVSLGTFLRRQVFADPDLVTAEMVNDYYATSHQPGAKWLPAAFVSGQLNYSVGRDLAQIPNPLHLAWGRAAGLTPLSQAEAFRSVRRDTTLEIFERSGLLPHEEQPEAFVRWALGVLG